MENSCYDHGRIGPCPPPLWAVDRKYCKLKISHTALIGLAARVAKQRRQRDSVRFVHKTVKVVPFSQTLLPALLLVFRRLRQLNESSTASQKTRSNWYSVSNNCSNIDIPKIMFWNIDGAAKHLFIAAVNCVTIFRFNK